MHYKVKCLPGFLCYAIYLVHTVSISSYDYSQVFTTACFQNFLVTKGVTQWNFNPSSRISYCLSFTGIYFHPIFYSPFPKVSRSFCNFSMSFLFVIFLHIIQLYAKSLILEPMFLHVSFTYTRNSSRPQMLP